MLYAIYWDNGVKEILEGTYPAEATSKSELRRDHGYFWEKDDKNKRVWCEDSKRWEWEEKQQIKHDPRFKPKMYFQNIQRLMEEKDFECLGMTELSTDTHEYHVHFCYPCRNTTMVFKLRDKAMLIVLTHAEQVFTDSKKYSDHWSIRIDCNVLSTWDDLASEEEYGRHNPSFSELKHLVHCGWSSAGYVSESILTRTWNIESRKKYKASVLVDGLKSGLEELMPYLVDGSVECLPTWDSTAFKNSSIAFWSGLDAIKVMQHITDSNHDYIKKKCKLTDYQIDSINTSIKAGSIKLDIPAGIGKA